MTQTLPLVAATHRYGDGPSLPAPGAAPVPWWSFTKPVLAAAALALVAQGKLALDAGVGETGFSLRELLQHRSGLRCYSDLKDYRDAVFAAEAPWPAGDMWENARADALLFTPGGGWFYSNIGYWIVRRLIERAAGVDLQTALRRLVFEPLGIVGPTVAATSADLSRTAWGNARGYDPAWVYHGLLIGHAEDAAATLAGLLWSDLLPDHLRRQMRDPYVIGGTWPGRPWAEAGYGLGLMIGLTSDARTVAGHAGQGPGSAAAVYADLESPSKTVVAVFLPAEDEGAAERACFSRLPA